MSGNGPAIRKVCAWFVELSRTLGLFAEAMVAIDGSKFKAVNNRDRNFTRPGGGGGAWRRSRRASHTSADRQEPSTARTTIDKDRMRSGINSPLNEQFAFPEFFQGCSEKILNFANRVHIFENSIGSFPDSHSHGVSEIVVSCQTQCEADKTFGAVGNEFVHPHNIVQGGTDARTHEGTGPGNNWNSHGKCFQRCIATAEKGSVEHCIGDEE